MNTYVIVIIVLTLLLLLTLTCGCMKQNVVPYEGFTKKVEGVDGSDNVVDGSDNVVDGSDNVVDGSDNVTNEEEGFTTLSYANIENYSPIDTISTVNGSMSCILQSSNLTNSMGPLCLSKEQQIALQTRGGNASCPPM